MSRIEANSFGAGIVRSVKAFVGAAALLLTMCANAEVVGQNVGDGDTISLTAGEGYIFVADGGSIYSWGYSNGGAMQLPGPTLIVPQGATFDVQLTNNLPAAAGNVSIVFPGLEVITTDGGVAGELTQEAASGGNVTYTVSASRPGTYQYHSGTQPDLQVEMGLYGAIVVEPVATTAMCMPAAIGGMAYDHAGACFDREYLFLLSEVDLDIHRAAELQAGSSGPIVLPAGDYVPEYWLLNGRAGPDTLGEPGDALLPHQPYNVIPRMHPGERLLLRIVGAGRQMHPFHTHGNHVRKLAQDGHLIVNGPGGALAGPNLFTVPSLPGSTVDAIFQWTGKDLGWDMYGTVADGMPAHDCVDNENNTTGDSGEDGYADMDSDYPWEWCADHDVSIPVTLPSLSSLAFGGFYSGSPYLGALGSLPPGEGGLNPNAGFTYMWHSHNERELVNNDVFPGGMMTMLIIEAPGMPITN
jgi:FtsP/CotA-like multicopper oxidase with cupredoxin domain